VICLFKKNTRDFTKIKFEDDHLVTMNSEMNACTCTNEGYSPECPQAFFQGGKILHALTGRDQLKPRIYENSSAPLPISDNAESKDQQVQAQKPMFANTLTEAPMSTREAAYREYLAQTSLSSESSMSSIESSYEQVERCFPSHLSTTAIPSARLGRGRLGDDSMMTEDNRKVLRKFEALQINGESLTGMSIGGYTVDLTKAAQKARDVAPLPPARLPIIFQDDDMNFFHHFFQGLDILMGSETVQKIVTSTKYYEQTTLQLLPLIEKMIKSGYERTDNEITVFAKKVLTSTFEVDEAHRDSDTSRVLIVAANLWGFQYIECGMQCREADLKMWLSICYNHYRTIWFNTFKSAGIPAFALDGVQTRYERPHGKSTLDSIEEMQNAPRELTLCNIEREKKYEARDFLREHRDQQSVKSHKSKRHRKTESSFGQIFGAK